MAVSFVCLLLYESEQSVIAPLVCCSLLACLSKRKGKMIILRSAGAASILALVLALALFTTGAFAQRTQAGNAASAHASKSVRTYAGGGPLPTTAPVAPAASAAAPAVPAPVHVVHRTRMVHRAHVAPAAHMIPGVPGVCCGSPSVASTRSVSIAGGLGNRGGFFGIRGIFRRAFRSFFLI